MPNVERVIPEKYKNKKIYSISRLLSFQNCRYGYYLHYIKKLKGKQNIYAYLGTIIHDSLEKMQVNKMTKEEAIQKFNESLLQCEILNMKFPSEKVAKNFTSCITNFLETYEPIDCKKAILEKEFYVEIGDNVLVGYIDATILNHDGTIEIIDYKTSSKYSKANIDEHGLQLVLYAIALEKLYGVNITKIKWNMLKYCTIEFQGATKKRTMFSERNKWVEKIKSELIKDLKNHNYNDLKIETLLGQAIKNNSLIGLPEDIQEKYKISNGYVEYPLTEKTKKDLIEFVNNSIECIESLPTEESELWTAKNINKEGSFFCGTLCDNSKECKYYKEFLNDNMDKFNPKEISLIESLFK